MVVVVVVIIINSLVNSFTFLIQAFSSEIHDWVEWIIWTIFWKNGSGETVMACGMHEPYKFPSLDSCQERFLRTQKEADLAPHQVNGLMLQVWDAGISFAESARRVSPVEEEERRQETYTTWSCLHSWWRCTAGSCLIWPFLPLLRQYWWVFLLSRCHHCTVLLPDTWNWTILLTSGRSCYYLHCWGLCCWSVSCSFLCRLPCDNYALALSTSLFVIWGFEAHHCCHHKIDDVGES